MAQTEGSLSILKLFIIKRYLNILMIIVRLYNYQDDKLFRARRGGVFFSLSICATVLDEWMNFGNLPQTIFSNSLVAK